MPSIVQGVVGLGSGYKPDPARTTPPSILSVSNLMRLSGSYLRGRFANNLPTGLNGIH